MLLLSLAFKSLWNRRVTVALTILTISISILLLLGVEKIRHEARSSFTQTVSGVDLIVGARTGAVQLLLYSVFRIGDASNNISWQSYQEIAQHSAVKWAIPISLGDSHKGFRVMGTSRDYFEYYRYARKQSLRFSEGQAFADVYDAVLGAEVADALGYQLGDAIIISHGTGSVSFVDHSNKPFRVVGILSKTGTPVDRTVHVSLEGITAIHVDWRNGVMPQAGQQLSAEQARAMDLQPKAITAFMLGLKSKISTFRLQRQINEYPQEALMAILPGVALQQLWRMVGIAEKALLVVSACVVLAGFVGLLTTILTSLNERRREMAILRSVGARPWHIFSLLVLEAVVVAVAGFCLGVVLIYLILFIAQSPIEAWGGMYISIAPPGLFELLLLAGVIIVAAIVGCIPAWRAYRNALSDGMTIRV